MEGEFIKIDGSTGEGGGSIVRLSMAFSALLNKPILISNIRSNRSNPGLRTQHLIGINLIQQIFGGELEGSEVGSTQIRYSPQEDFDEVQSHISIKIDTAASIGLIIQTLQLAMVRLKKEFTIEMIGGGTYGLWAPSIDYIKHVTLSYLTYFGINFEIDVVNHGFYPKGGAKVILKLKSSEMNPKHLVHVAKREGKPEIQGISIASRHLQRAKVATRIANEAIKLFNNSGFNCDINPLYVETSSAGAGITVWTKDDFPFGSSFVSKRGFSSENVARLLVRQFMDDWKNNGMLDEYMTDQIIPFMALYPAEIITGPLSKHTTTNIWISSKFLSTKFDIKELKPNLFSICSKKM